MESILAAMTGLDKLTLGGNTMLLGLVMVFVVLGILIGMVTLIKICLAKASNKGNKKKVEDKVAPKAIAPAPVQESNANDEEVVAAITAAISMFYETQSSSVGKSVKFKVRSIREIR